LPASAPPDPCLPRGYVSPDGLRGAGDFDACADALRRVVPGLNATAASAAGPAGRRRPIRCPKAFRKQGGCVLGTAALRPPFQDAALIGLDNFFYAARALGLAARQPPPSVSSSSSSSSSAAAVVQANPTLAELERAARALCAKPWSEQQRQLGPPPGKQQPPPRSGAASERSESLAFLPRACVASVYIGLLLREGLGLPADSSQVSFSNSVALPSSSPSSPKAPVKAVEATWTLGALLIEALELGGSVGVAGRDGAWGAVEAEGAASTSPGALAGAAALFCLTTMGLMAVASYLQIGVAWPPPAGGVRSARLSMPGGGGSGGGGGGGGGAAGGLGEEYASLVGDGPSSSSTGNRSPLLSSSPLPVSDRNRRTSLGEAGAGRGSPSPLTLGARPGALGASPRTGGFLSGGGVNGGGGGLGGVGLVSETELISLTGGRGSSPPPGLGGAGALAPGGGGGGGGGAATAGAAAQTGGAGALRASARRPPGISPRVSGAGAGVGPAPAAPGVFPSLSPRRGATTGSAGPSFL
jgi:hypothetical protein